MQINASDDLSERRSIASIQSSDVESLNDIAGTSGKTGIVNAIERDDDVDSHLSISTDFTSVTALSSFSEDLFDIDSCSGVSISTEYQELFDLLSIDEKAVALDDDIVSKDTNGSYTISDIAHIILDQIIADVL